MTIVIQDFSLCEIELIGDILLGWIIKTRREGKKTWGTAMKILGSSELTSTAKLQDAEARQFSGNLFANKRSKLRWSWLH